MNCESAPHSRFALHLDVPSMFLDDFPGEGQTEARSPRLPREEGVEDFIEILRRNARTVVVDTQRDVSVAGGGPDADGALSRQSVEGIENEVYQYLLHLVAVKKDFRYVLLQVGFQ